MIHVIATIELLEGQLDAFLREFKNLVPEVLNEDGCIEYGPTMDVETNIAAQLEARTDVVTVVEKWESLDALEAHLTAPHMLAYRQRVKSMVQNATLQVLRPA